MFGLFTYIVKTQRTQSFTFLSVNFKKKENKNVIKKNILNFKYLKLSVCKADTLKSHQVRNDRACASEVTASL